ncbi:Transcriptional regulator, MarR family (fragment) [Modestobacter italicus]|uniref:Transcriptional regulator, MarR family n=1 Tax=Modestobacter italicus (strain DSM 44449 / CECT 9708 / BC 501) TaxID=2732864 RepID=I4EX22_MODI5
MHHQLISADAVLRTLSSQEKRRHLTLLSESIWDIEDQLARARAARAELMTSLQSDIRSGSTAG